MGFSNDKFAKVWSVEDKGNYSICQLSVSKKNKETNNYEVEFQDSYVRFVGTAHKDISNMDIPENGLSIKITSCDVTNRYVKEKKQLYTNYVVFGFEIPDGNGGKPTNTNKTTTRATAAVEDDSDDDLPF